MSEPDSNKSRRTARLQSPCQSLSVTSADFICSPEPDQIRLPFGTSRGLFPGEYVEPVMSSLTDELEIEEFKEHVSGETYKILEAMKKIHDRKLTMLSKNCYSMQRQIEKLQGDTAKALGTSKFCYAFCKGMEDSGVYKLPSSQY